MKQLAIAICWTLVGLSLLIGTVSIIRNFESENETYLRIQNSKISFSNTAPQTILPQAPIADRNVIIQKLSYAENVLAQLWTNELTKRGYRFRAPRVIRNAIASPCDNSPVRDAYYCPANNTIYLNDNFLFFVVDSTGARLRSDGDFAALTVLAHEVGHSVSAQTTGLHGNRLDNEQSADCYAGVFALYSSQLGLLEQGDLQEASDGLAAASDKFAWTFSGTHGTAQMRISAFYRGFRGGVSACGNFR